MQDPTSKIHKELAMPSYVRPLVIECLFPVHRPRPLKLAAWYVIIGSAIIMRMRSRSLRNDTRYYQASQSDLCAVAIRPSLTEMLLTVTASASLSRSFVPWTIIKIHEQSYTFESLFTSLQASCFDSVVMSDELKRAELVQSLVGSKRNELMATSNGQSVVEVCSEFGKFVRFSVELRDVQLSEAAVPVLNAFDVMTAAQKRLQGGENGLPFPERVKDGRSQLYNDLLSLMKEMGISWNAPLAYGVLFLNKLCDCLRYIDGHHDAIAEKAPKLPQLFACFTGIIVLSLTSIARG